MLRDVKKIATYCCTIHIAGDADVARATCRAYCNEFGLCVTVERSTYIYRGGEEAGVRIGLVNYPRLPLAPTELDHHAVTLAQRLRRDLGQESWMVVTPTDTLWSSTRTYTNPRVATSNDVVDWLVQIGESDVASKVYSHFIGGPK